MTLYQFNICKKKKTINKYIFRKSIRKLNNLLIKKKCSNFYFEGG